MEPQDPEPKEVAPSTREADLSPTAEASQPVKESATSSENNETSHDHAPSPSGSSGGEPGEIPHNDQQQDTTEAAPPLPNEEPPLPNEPPPHSAAAAATAPEDDGWDFHWDPTHQAYFFHNRFTGASTWENPRLATDAPDAATENTRNPASAAAATAAPGTTPSTTLTEAAPPPLPTDSQPAAGGYNPAIHGDYDPTAWYAQAGNAGAEKNQETEAARQYQLALHQQQMMAANDPSLGGGEYGASAGFNRFTGRFQADGGDGAERHTDEAKSNRHMNAFFDVEAAANAHQGRSLKAERSGKKPSKAELKQFKEKRKARKEEKRRAWLRD